MYSAELLVYYILCTISDKNPQPQKILRTVENDIEIIDDDDDDPMGEEYIPTKLLNRKASLQLKIITHNNGARDKPPSTTNR